MGKRCRFDIHTAGPPQGAGATIERGAGRKDVINEYMAQAGIKVGPRLKCKGIFQVGLPGAPVETRLAGSIGYPPEQRDDARPCARGARESRRQAFALVKSAFALFPRMQGHGNKNSAPHMGKDLWSGAKDRLHISQNMKAAMVLEFDEKGARPAPKEDGGAVSRESRIQGRAVGTSLPVRDGDKRVPAGFAAGPPDKIQPAGAIRA